MESQKTSATSTENRRQSRDEIVAHLERLSRLAVEAMNLQDWDLTGSWEGREMRPHISSDFTAIFDNFPGSLTLSEHFAAQRTLVEPFGPGVYEITGISTRLEEEIGHASVFVHVNLNWGDLKMPGLGEFRWRRVEGKWWWYHHWAMRQNNLF